MHKNKCITDVIVSVSKKEPVFKEWAELKGRTATWNTQQTAKVEHIQTLATERDKAVCCYYSDNSLASFNRCADAIDACRKAEAAQGYMSGFGGASSAHMTTPEAEAIILKCTRLVRDALAKKIRSLNDEEQARLAAEGLDSEGREHPAISDLKVYLGLLAESIVELETRKENGNSVLMKWKSHAQLFDIK